MYVCMRKCIDVYLLMCVCMQVRLLKPLVSLLPSLLLVSLLPSLLYAGASAQTPSAIEDGQSPQNHEPGPVFVLSS
jgi:hypothetical protein